MSKDHNDNSEKLENLISTYLESREQNILGQVFAFYINHLYRVALTVCRNSGDAEDIVQKTFLHLLSKPFNFQRTSNDRTLEQSFKSWLTRICVNMSKMHLRSKKIEQKSRLKKRNLVESNMNNYPKADKNLMLKVEDALRNLPVKYALPIKLKYQEDMSYSEISSIVEAKESTVRSLVSRGIEMLRNNLSTSAKSITIVMLVKLVSQQQLQAAPVSLVTKCLSLTSVSNSTRLMQAVGYSSNKANKLNVFFKYILMLLFPSIIGIYFYLIKSDENIKPIVNSKASGVNTLAPPQVIDPGEFWDFSKQFNKNLEVVNGTWFHDSKNGVMVIEHPDKKNVDTNQWTEIKIPGYFELNQKFSFRGVADARKSRTKDFNISFSLLPNVNQKEDFKPLLNFSARTLTMKEIALDYNATTYMIGKYHISYVKGMGVKIAVILKKDVQKVDYLFYIKGLAVYNLSRETLKKEDILELISLLERTKPKKLGKDNEEEYHKMLNYLSIYMKDNY